MSRRNRALDRREALPRLRCTSASRATPPPARRLDVVVTLPARIVRKIDADAKEREVTVAGWRRAEIIDVFKDDVPGTETADGSAVAPVLLGHDSEPSPGPLSIRSDALADT